MTVEHNRPEGETRDSISEIAVYRTSVFSILQDTAIEFTKAGLGNYKIIVDDYQTHPDTDKKLKGFTRFIFTGPEDRNSFWSVVGGAKEARKIAIYFGDDEADLGVVTKAAIIEGIKTEKERNALRIERLSADSETTDDTPPGPDRGPFSTV